MFVLVCKSERESVITSVTRLGDYWTLCNCSKPLATINLPKSPTCNFCKVVKMYYFLVKSFWQLLWTFGDFLLVILVITLSANLTGIERDNACRPVGFGTTC